MTNRTKGFLGFLTVLVTVSLALNIFLLWQWFSFMQQALQMGQMTQVALNQAVSDLAELEQTSIQFSVPVKEEIPVKTTIPFKRTIEVPIDTTIPIDKEVKAQVPIEINGVKIPIDVVVPVKMNVPVKLTQKVNLDFEVPVNTSVSLDLEIPVNISLSDAGMAGYVERLRSMLNSLNESITNSLP